MSPGSSQVKSSPAQCLQVPVKSSPAQCLQVPVKSNRVQPSVSRFQSSQIESSPVSPGSSQVKSSPAQCLQVPVKSSPVSSLVTRDGALRQVSRNLYQQGKVAPPLPGAAQGGQSALPPVPLRGTSLPGVQIKGP